MRILGTEPSSAILRQSGFKSRKCCPKVRKYAEAKRDGVMNPHNYNLNEFLYGQFWFSQNATN